jgi:diketogulonate reductase-like aldo/keto reductase
MNWKPVESELKELQSGNANFDELSYLTKDTLYGTMWGLNIRYQTIHDALFSNKEGMINESLKKVQQLLSAKLIETGDFKPLEARRIGLGTYGWKYGSEIIKEAYKRNIALIDTAEGYGYGRVETELGNIIKENGFQSLNVTTKVSRNHMSPVALVAAAERSNVKLGIVPHYQLHFPNCSYSDIQIGKALVQLRKAGKIKSIGLGNCSVAMIESMRNFLWNYSQDVVKSVQVAYNLGDRRIESALLPYCQENGIEVIAYSPLGQSFDKLCKPILQKIAKLNNATPAQVALAWILSRSGVVPIPRTNSVKHLQENLEASELILSDTSIEELELVYKRGDE